MAGAEEVVLRYFEAWTSGDFDTARGLLQDDLSFEGPIDTFDNADDFMQPLLALGQMLERAELRRSWADGDDVCIWYDLTTGPTGTGPVAEWHRVREGKIAEMRIVFDARPYAPLFEGR